MQEMCSIRFHFIYSIDSRMNMVLLLNEYYGLLCNSRFRMKNIQLSCELPLNHIFGPSVEQILIVVDLSLRFHPFDLFYPITLTPYRPAEFIPRLISSLNPFDLPLDLVSCLCVGTRKTAFGLLVRVAAESPHQWLRITAQSTLYRGAASTTSPHRLCKSLRERRILISAGGDRNPCLLFTLLTREMQFGHCECHRTWQMNANY
jgi:hypothetical protein